MWSKPRRANAAEVAGTKHTASMARGSKLAQPSRAGQADASSSAVAMAAAMTGASRSSWASFRHETMRAAVPANLSAQMVVRVSHSCVHSRAGEIAKRSSAVRTRPRWAIPGETFLGTARRRAHRASRRRRSALATEARRRQRREAKRQWRGGPVRRWLRLACDPHRLHGWGSHRLN